MSMPVNTIYCDSCDFRVMNFVFWGRFVYELPNGESYPLLRTTGWCCNCQSFRPIEDLLNNIEVKELIGNRPPKCLECGSDLVKPVPIEYPEEKNRPSDLNFIHPECGGKMWVVEKSPAVRMGITDRPKRYDLNGDFLGRKTPFTKEAINI